MADISQTYNFNNAANYTLNQAAVSSGKGKLALTTLSGLDFIQNFTSSTGFSYDVTKAEFVGGQVQQKAQGDGALFGANFSVDEDANWAAGSATGILVNATINAGKLDCTGGGLKFCRYSSTSNMGIQKGCIRFRVTPGYGYPPPSQYYLFCQTTSPAPTFGGALSLYHTASSDLRLQCKNSAGVSVFTVNLGKWYCNSGQEYVFEVDYDFDAGATRVFINGTQLGATIPDVFSRGANVARLVLGTEWTETSVTDYSFDDILLFDTVQHTSNHSSAYSVPDTKYAASNVTLPEMEYTNVGQIQAFEQFTTTEGGVPKYTIQIGRSGNYLYYDGSQWDVSDGSYAQATDVATFNTNCGSLPIQGEIYGQFKVHFTNTNVQASVDVLTATMTGQQYYSSGTIITLETTAEDFSAFTDTVTNTANTTVTYAIYVDGVLKYWDGAAFSTSDGSFAQTNTSADINSHIGDLLSAPATTKFYILIVTSDRQETGKIDTLTFAYDHGGPPTTPAKCIIWGYYRDISGNPVSGAVVSFSLVRKSSEYKEAANNIIEKPISTTTRVSGYFEQPLIRSSEYEGTAAKYIVSISKPADNLNTAKTSTGVKLEITVPDAVDRDITTLLTAT